MMRTIWTLIKSGNRPIRSRRTARILLRHPRSRVAPRLILLRNSRMCSTDIRLKVGIPSSSMMMKISPKRRRRKGRRTRTSLGAAYCLSSMAQPTRRPLPPGMNAHPSRRLLKRAPRLCRHPPHLQSVVLGFSNLNSRRSTPPFSPLRLLMLLRARVKIL